MNGPANPPLFLIAFTNPMIGSIIALSYSFLEAFGVPRKLKRPEAENFRPCEFVLLGK
jgi:hypothetical protein